MKVKTGIFIGLIFFLFCFVMPASAELPYAIIENESSYDLYVGVLPNTSCIEVTLAQGYTPTPSNVFELYEDNFSYVSVENITNPILTRAVTNQTTPTPDGTGQVVHPSMKKFDTAWHGYTYWMAISPYYHANDQLENPCILASNDGATWVVPENVVNPLVGAPSGGFNSDPEIEYNDETDQLYIYYREFINANQTMTLKLIKFDGVSVTQPISILTDIKTPTNEVEKSQSIIKVNDTWHYYACDSDFTSNVIYRSSTDGVNFSSPTELGTLYDFSVPPWHVDVQYINGKWVMLEYQINLYLAVSDFPNTGWRAYPKALLNAGGATWDSGLYKGTFIYNSTSDDLEIWYTGNNTDNDWFIGYTSAGYTSTLDKLAGMPFTLVYGSPTITVSEGVINVSGGSIGTRNIFSSDNSMFESNASLGNLGTIGFLPGGSGGTAGSYLKNGAHAYFYSVVGDGATFAAVDSDLLKDTNFHNLNHFVSVSDTYSYIDKIHHWHNSAKLYTGNRGIWFTDNVSVDYIFATNNFANSISIESVSSDYIVSVPSSPTNQCLKLDGGIVGITSLQDSILIEVADQNDTIITKSSTSGFAPLTVQYTYNATSAPISISWDFENDGIIDSTKQNPVHTYGKAGTYTVNLTVQNEYGNFSTVKTDYITVSAPAFASDPVAWFNWVFSYLFGRF